MVQEIVAFYPTEAYRNQALHYTSNINELLPIKRLEVILVDHLELLSEDFQPAVGNSDGNRSMLAGLEPEFVFNDLFLGVGEVGIELFKPL